MATNRLFEVGDFVIFSNNKTAEIHSIIQYCHNPIVVKSWSGFRYFRYEDVKTIRKPRKGNPEARAIVAMLGRMYHRNLLGTLKHWCDFTMKIEEKTVIDNYWDIRKRGGFREQSDTYLAFIKAKKMLGNND